MAEQESRMLPTELGVVRISEDVVSIIAGLAAAEIEGVASMSGGVAGGISEVLGRKSMSKGIKVEVGTEEAKIDIFIIVQYGARIPDVSWDIQESVKKTVENMTGLRVTQVNVHVQGVHFPQAEAAADEEASEEIEATEEKPK